MRKPLIHTLVNFIVRYALIIMPKSRSEWGLAMMAETKYLTNDYQALCWSLGCLKTATLERILTMKTGTLRVSKYVLSLEVMCCFVPVSLLFAQLIYAVLTVFDGEISAENIYVYIFCVLALIGPAGIIMGTKLLLKGPFVLGKTVKSILYFLAAGSVIAGVFMLANGFINLNDWGLVLLLICLLPALTIAHLIYLSHDKGMQLSNQG